MAYYSDMPSTVDLINSYADEHHDKNFVCDILPLKGRVLLSQKELHAGEPIMREPPLHTVCADKNHPIYLKLERWCEKHDFSLDPIWYWCALNSLIVNDGVDAGAEDSASSESEEGVANKSSQPYLNLQTIPSKTKARLLMLYIPEIVKPSREVRLLIKKLGLGSVCTGWELETMLRIWILNCFEYTDDPLGFAIFFMPAFCSHSCMPNAVWFFNDHNEFVLITRRKINPNDEITLSYISEDGLYEPTPLRQHSLEATKDFTCTCARCLSPSDLSRGFRCPRCRRGTVYLSADAGTSRDRIPPAVNSQSVKDCSSSASLPRLERCVKCKCALTHTERTNMLKLEKRLIRHLRRLQSDTDEELKVDAALRNVPDDTTGRDDTAPKDHLSLSFMETDVTETSPDNSVSTPAADSSLRDGFLSTQSTTERACEKLLKNSDFEKIPFDKMNSIIQSLFTEHWILILWHTQLASWFDERRDYANAVKRIELKLELLKSMFSQLTGTYAWTLEDYADHILMTHGVSVCPYMHCIWYPIFAVSYTSYQLHYDIYVYILAYIYWIDVYVCSRFQNP
eukprot:GHVO01032762.1.p1 GENE.GHVO01032762.1~~GHVO01032762.1.p1  ORF type:complete len:568 (+),score=61.75 GHVO01032762.1:38-1741(+)